MTPTEMVASIVESNLAPAFALGYASAVGLALFFMTIKPGGGE